MYRLSTTMPAALGRRYRQRFGASGPFPRPPSRTNAVGSSTGGRCCLRKTARRCELPAEDLQLERRWVRLFPEVSRRSDFKRRRPAWEPIEPPDPRATFPVKICFDSQVQPLRRVPESDSDWRVRQTRRALQRRSNPGKHSWWACLLPNAPGLAMLLPIGGARQLASVVGCHPLTVGHVGQPELLA